MFNNAHASQSLILTYYYEATLGARKREVAVLVSNTKIGFSLEFSFLFFNLKSCWLSVMSQAVWPEQFLTKQFSRYFHELYEEQQTTDVRGCTHFLCCETLNALINSITSLVGGQSSSNLVKSETSTVPTDISTWLFPIMLQKFC